MGAVDDVVERLTDRDDVVDGQPVGVVLEHLLHDLQRGAFALHLPGQRAQGGDQGRGERVGQLERVGIGAAVRIVGVDAIEQHVLHLGVAVQARGRGLQRGGGVGIAGLQQSLVGDVWTKSAPRAPLPLGPDDGGFCDVPPPRHG
ncbi:hypothetical protein R1X32_00475 (plasmid) [Rhodococcus opacus]|uniref:hypothetical protein n=1 Tax=Rhodococcus opacus TaxID=37919 RepID=UPI0034D32A0F